MTASVPMTNDSGGGRTNANLAAMLRQCADQVERNEMDPRVIQSLVALTEYIKRHGADTDTNVATAPTTTKLEDQEHPIKERSCDEDAPKEQNSKPKLASSLFSEDISSDFSQPKEPTVAAQNLRQQQPAKDKFTLGNLKNSLTNVLHVAGEKTNHVRSNSEKNPASRKNPALTKQDLANLAEEAATNARPISPSTPPPPPLEPEKGSKMPPSPAASAAGNKNSSALASPARATYPNTSARPAFQRPVNPKSTLIANGWIEQQRRSKMRLQWKDILASLVEGSKTGEETTLWIQRQVVDSQTGKASLEALHQIPMKWLEHVTFLDFSGDYRFSIKVYNVTEEFFFRCRDKESAQNWVLTLRSSSDTEQKKNKKHIIGQDPNNGKRLDTLDDWDVTMKKEQKEEQPQPQQHLRQHEQQQQPPQQANQKMAIRDLRAVAHGAGHNTSGMERTELENLVKDILAASQALTQQKEAAVEEQRRRQQQQQQQQQTSDPQGYYPSEQEAEMAAAEALHKQQKEEEQRLLDSQRKRQDDDESNRLISKQRKRKEEGDEHNRLLAEQKRRQEEDERRQLVEDEQRRLYAEQQRRHAAEVEQKNRVAAEQHAAEQRQKQQAWQASQWQAQQAAQAAQQRAQWEQNWSAQQNQQHQQNQFYPQPQQQNQQQPPAHYAQAQQQQQPPPAAHHPQQQPPPAPPAQQQPSPASKADMKYAKMADQKGINDGQAAVTAIKRNILIHWALQPPMLQMLRPIEMLLTSIHTVFPPAFGVVGHAYFTKWNPITKESLVLTTAMGNNPDEDKLKKGVRKLRFFLHPDKIPRDLTDEQSFMVKMLWDVTSDAWEEHNKQKEELGWMR